MGCMSWQVEAEARITAEAANLPGHSGEARSEPPASAPGRAGDEEGFY